MTTGALKTVWILTKRDLRSDIYGVSIYVAIFISLVISSIILLDFLKGIGRDRLLIATDPFVYPFSLATVVCAIYLALVSVTSIAREKEMQTLEVLFYGPVDHFTYILSKYLRGVFCHIYILLFIAVYFLFASMVTNLSFSIYLLWFFPLSLFLCSCLITFGVLISTLAATARTSVLLFLSITLALISIQLAHGVLVRIEEVDLVSSLFYMRETIAVISSVVRWVSPFHFLERGIEAITLRNTEAYALSLAFSMVYSMIAVFLAFQVFKKRGVRGAAVSTLILVGFVVSPVQARNPVMEEQLVYGLGLFDGKGYSRSFCPRSAGSIYIIAESENVFLPRMTVVYYWPLKRRYEAGFATLNEPVEGTLEVSLGGGVIRKIRSQTYTYRSVGQGSARRLEILTGHNAGEIYRSYKQAVEEYQRELYEKIQALKERGGFPGEDILAPAWEMPAPPPELEAYVQRPREGYIVNLPAGHHSIRVRAPDGTIIEGSEKQVVSFTHRRSGQVGYEIIDPERWTDLETTSSSSDVVYFEGKNILYFRPSLQREYPDLHYSKLLDPQNEERRRLWRWVKIKPIEKGLMQLLRDGQVVASIEEKPYLVEQIPGAERGYIIVNYDAGKHPESGPTFQAHKVEFDPEKGDHQIRLVDASGEVVAGSVRELRAVEAGKALELYAASAFLPLLIGGSLVLWRRRRTR